MTLFEEHKIIAEIRDVCEKLVETGAAKTMADLEAAVAVINPEAPRLLQEAMLLSICRRLPRDAVETIIGTASALEGMIAGEKAAAEALAAGEVKP